MHAADSETNGQHTVCFQCVYELGKIYCNENGVQLKGTTGLHIVHTIIWLMAASHVHSILKVYSSTSYSPPASQYTIAASFFLTRSSSPDCKVISVATGTKCLPTARLPSTGEAVHDSHAEVLARRGAIRWFLEEIGRCHDGTTKVRDSDMKSNTAYQTDWICQSSQHGRYKLRDDVQIHLYVSTVPCGDASTRLLACMQDEEMATLKDSMVIPSLNPNAASRGRDDYSRLGVLRTKPGRADSPPTLCMSCSDKIASWNVLGFQGALAARFFEPLYLSTVVIGEVPLDMQDTVKDDCERAFWKRLEPIRDLPPGYILHTPAIQFTSHAFTHSRIAVGGAPSIGGSCNESLCWIADSEKPHEVLINGLKRGVPPKHRFRDKSRPQVSKVSLFQIYMQTLICLRLPTTSPTSTYFHVKQSITEYQAARQALVEEGCPFSGWRISGERWESFDVNGEGRTTTL